MPDIVRHPHFELIDAHSDTYGWSESYTATVATVVNPPSEKRKREKIVYEKSGRKVVDDCGDSIRIITIDLDGEWNTIAEYSVDTDSPLYIAVMEHLLSNIDSVIVEEGDSNG